MSPERSALDEVSPEGTSAMGASNVAQLSVDRVGDKTDNSRATALTERCPLEGRISEVAALAEHMHSAFVCLQDKGEQNIVQFRELVQTRTSLDRTLL